MLEIYQHHYDYPMCKRWLPYPMDRLIFFRTLWLLLWYKICLYSFRKCTLTQFIGVRVG